MSTYHVLHILYLYAYPIKIATKLVILTSVLQSTLTQILLLRHTRCLTLEAKVGIEYATGLENRSTSNFGKVSFRYSWACMETMYGVRHVYLVPVECSTAALAINGSIQNYHTCVYYDSCVQIKQSTVTALA